MAVSLDQPFAMFLDVGFVGLRASFHTHVHLKGVYQVIAFRTLFTDYPLTFNLQEPRDSDVAPSCIPLRSQHGVRIHSLLAGGR